MESIKRNPKKTLLGIFVTLFGIGLVLVVIAIIATMRKGTIKKAEEETWTSAAWKWDPRNHEWTDAEKKVAVGVGAVGLTAATGMGIAYKYDKLNKESWEKAKNTLCFWKKQPVDPK